LRRKRRRSRCVTSSGDPLASRPSTAYLYISYGYVLVGCAIEGDLVRFANALIAGKLLPESARRMMWTVQRTAAGEPTGHGLGWTISKDGSEISHGGTTIGGSAYLYLRPADGIVVAFVTNLSLWTEGREELASRLADLVANHAP